MFYSDDMVWFMWQKCIVLVYEAVFAPMAGAIANKSAKFSRHILAHPFLTALSCSYSRFHHPHQELRLFVVIQLEL
jgi:hypothetical protein